MSSSPSNIDRYWPMSQKWEKFAEMPSQRTKFGLAKLENGRLLVIGGKTEGKRLSSFDEFDPSSRKWLPSGLELTSAKSGFGCVSLNSRDSLESFTLIGFRWVQFHFRPSIRLRRERWRFNPQNIRGLRLPHKAEEEFESNVDGQG